MKIYTYKNCSTCKKATQWLRSKGCEFDEVPIRDTPPNIKELEAMLVHLGGELRLLFNTSGRDYRALDMKNQQPAMSQSEALNLLSQNGNLVKRPFLLGEQIGLVGFKECIWAQALK